MTYLQTQDSERTISYTYYNVWALQAKTFISQKLHGIESSGFTVKTQIIHKLENHMHQSLDAACRKVKIKELMKIFFHGNQLYFD